jgi:hypothetical protein
VWVNPSPDTDALVATAIPRDRTGCVMGWVSCESIEGAGGEDDAEVEAASISANAKTSNAMGRWVTVAFFGVFLIIGLIVTCLLAVGPVLKARNAKSWIEAPCEIVWSKVRRHKGDSDSRPTYSVDIFYRYDFDGFTGHSNAYNFSSGSSSGRRGKKAIVQRYPGGL